MLENNLFKQYFSNVLYPLSLIGSFIRQFLKSPQQSKVAAIVVRDDNTHLKSTDSPTGMHFYTCNSESNTALSSIFRRNFSLRLVFQWPFKNPLASSLRYFDLVAALGYFLPFFHRPWASLKQKIWICKHEFGLFVLQYTRTAKNL